MKVNVHNSRGICNRLKSILSMLRVGNEINLIWNKNHLVNCEFNDLFENKFRICDRIYYNFNQWQFVLTDEEREKYELEHINFMYNDTPDELKKSICNICKILEPIDYIQYKIDEFKHIFDEDISTLSIRSYPETSERSINVHRIYERIDTIQGDIFITCDNQQIAKKIINDYGSRILYYPKRTHWGDSKSTIGMQDIIIDLYLGGMAKTLYASWHSTFSEMQWFFGGCKARVMPWLSFEKNKIKRKSKKHNIISSNLVSKSRDRNKRKSMSQTQRRVNLRIEREIQSDGHCHLSRQTT